MGPEEVLKTYETARRKAGHGNTCPNSVRVVRTEPLREQRPGRLTR
jgi:hypothetical protein